MFFDFTIRKNGSKNCIKLCVKTKIKYASTLEMLVVTFGEPTMRRTKVRFKEGQEDVNDDAQQPIKTLKE